MATLHSQKTWPPLANSRMLLVLHSGMWLQILRRKTFVFLIFEGSLPKLPCPAPLGHLSACCVYRVCLWAHRMVVFIVIDASFDTKRSARPIYWYIPLLDGTLDAE